MLAGTVRSMDTYDSVEDRIGEYWDWVAVGLFLLLTVDLLTSLFAMSVVGVEHEANPLMAWLLTQSLPMIVGVHIAAAVLEVIFFYGLFELLRGARGLERKILVRGLEIYLGFLVTLGLFIFANNLSVIILQESLL